MNIFADTIDSTWNASTHFDDLSTVFLVLDNIERYLWFSSNCLDDDDDDDDDDDSNDEDAFY
jgi:hypothetical protein